MLLAVLDLDPVPLTFRFDRAVTRFAGWKPQEDAQHGSVDDLDFIRAVLNQQHQYYSVDRNCGF